jgi:hypothetical protein
MVAAYPMVGRFLRATITLSVSGTSLPLFLIGAQYRVGALIDTTTKRT